MQIRTGSLSKPAPESAQMTAHVLAARIETVIHQSANPQSTNLNVAASELLHPLRPISDVFSPPSKEKIKKKKDYLLGTCTDPKDVAGEQQVIL